MPLYLLVVINSTLTWCNNIEEDSTGAIAAVVKVVTNDKKEDENQENITLITEGSEAIDKVEESEEKINEEAPYLMGMSWLW